jgi:hypothetical protein
MKEQRAAAAMNLLIAGRIKKMAGSFFLCKIGAL